MLKKRIFILSFVLAVALLMVPTGVEANDPTVYTTKTGTKYHWDRHCRGLNNAKSIYQNNLSTAQAMGLSECSICGGGSSSTNHGSRVTASISAGWKKSSGKWWYQNSDGSYPKNTWKKISGKWYHFDKSGYMQTGWQKISGKWYYLGKDGKMTTGWQKVSRKWYYMDKNGIMQTNKWIGKYYVQKDGTMAVNKWIGKYHVNKSGKRDKTR